MRGFTPNEFNARLSKAQILLQKSDLDCLLVTNEADFRYFTGFLTRFWESPTRPWYLLIFANYPPITIVPSIGVHLLKKTWSGEIRSWESPNVSDEGISLLQDILSEFLPKNGRVGLPSGPETLLRMPLVYFNQLRSSLDKLHFVSDCEIVKNLRLIKSDSEVKKISQAAAIAGRAFSRINEVAGSGVQLSKVFRDFQALCLDEGADWVSYLAGASEQGGYSDVISPAKDAPLVAGDVLMLDTGVVYDGYFCDYNRNFGVTETSNRLSSSWDRLQEATEAGKNMLIPGNTAKQVFFAMNAILQEGKKRKNSSGRLGHGLGMQLTEWPSFSKYDETILQEGMVVTLEPIIDIDDEKILVHEDNFLITANGPEQISPQCNPTIPII